MTNCKKVDRIDIPPEKVRDVIFPWVYKVLTRIKQEEMAKQTAGGMRNEDQTA